MNERERLRIQNAWRHLANERLRQRLYTSDTVGFVCSEDCSETKAAVDGGRLTLSWSAGLGLGAGAIGEGSRRSSSHQGFVSVRPAVVSSGGTRCKMLSTAATEGYRQGLIAEAGAVRIAGTV